MNSSLIEIFKNENGQLLYLTENKDLLCEGEVHPEDSSDPNRAQEELPWHSTLMSSILLKEIYNNKITSSDAYKEALDNFRAKYWTEDGYYAISMDKEAPVTSFGQDFQCTVINAITGAACSTLTARIILTA